MAEKQFKVGDKVNITFGCFTGFSGTIESINDNNGDYFPYSIMLYGRIYGYYDSEFVLAK